MSLLFRSGGGWIVCSCAVNSGGETSNNVGGGCKARSSTETMSEAVPGDGSTRDNFFFPPMKPQRLLHPLFGDPAAGRSQACSFSKDGIIAAFHADAIWLWRQPTTTAVQLRQNSAPPMLIAMISVSVSCSFSSSIAMASVVVGVVG